MRLSVVASCLLLGASAQFDFLWSDATYEDLPPSPPLSKSPPPTYTLSRARAEASRDALGSLSALISAYLRVHHGGGEADRAEAASIFSHRASMLAVGSSPEDAPPTAWCAAPR